MTDREKALADARAAIEKRWGEDTFKDDVVVGSVSTGILSLDHAIGVGGFPRGRMTMIVGPEGSGKTSSQFSAIGIAQSIGGNGAFIDMEAKADHGWARTLGVDTDKWLYARPKTGEQAIDIAITLMEAGIDIVAIDSIPAMRPDELVNGGDIKAKQYALIANMLSHNLSLMCGIAAENNSALVFTNQQRVKIGARQMFPGHEPLRYYGGKAPGYYSSVVIELRKIYEKGDAKKRQVRIGAKIEKNQVSEPQRKCEFTITYAEGIDKLDDVYSAACATGVIDVAGSWYSFEDTKLQGGDKFKDAMRDNQDLFDAIAAKVSEA